MTDYQKKAEELLSKERRDPNDPLEGNYYDIEDIDRKLSDVWSAIEGIREHLNDEGDAATRIVRMIHNRVDPYSITPEDVRRALHARRMEDDE